MGIKLIEPTGVTLSNSQKGAVKEIKSWLEDKRSLSFTLSGSAGTGKTWLINYILSNVIKNKRITVAAPTHKAVRVIENFTGKRGFTLHSLHGLRPNFNISDFSISNITFKALGTNKFSNYDLIVIDEASMIGKDIHKLNILRANQFKTRILYLGDKLQLLPVKENKISEAFSSNYEYELTDIIRQGEDNPLLELLVMLRFDIPNNKASFLNYIAKNKRNVSNGVGYNVYRENDFKSNILKAFTSDEFKNDINSYRVATYSNESVNNWNMFIRNTLIESNELLAKGDKLTGYKTIVDEYLSPVIINSNDYEVLDVESRISDDGFKVFNVLIRDLDTQFDKEIYIVDHKVKSFAKYYYKLCQLHRDAVYSDPIKKGAAWKMYYNYKDTFMCMIDFDLVYGNRKNGRTTREIDYAYALTTHKLQGSTIKNIYLDAINMCYYQSNRARPRVNTLNNNNVLNTRNRLLYTSLSRASNIGNILYY